MKIRPLGHRVLVEPFEIEETTKSGIVLVRDTVDRERHGQVRGRVIALGRTAFKDLEMKDVQRQISNTVTITTREGEVEVKVGDIVVYQRYAGVKIPDPEAEDGFVPNRLLLNDKDLAGVIEEND